MTSTWSHLKDLDTTSCSIKSEESTSTNEDNDDCGNDAEGVWSPDIEQSFHEALAIYPPCGRRKIILSEEGKMYGRNELISRYIKMRTGKSRTRKQVSSHIQVLAKRKAKEIQTMLKDPSTKDHRAFSTLNGIAHHHAEPYFHHHHRAMNPLFSPSTSPLSPFIPAYSSQSAVWQSNSPYTDVKPFSQSSYSPQSFSSSDLLVPTATTSWTSRFIGTNRLKLVEFTGYIEQKKDSDLNSRHYFFHVSQAAGTQTMPEKIKIDVVVDKFPNRDGSLKDLYDKGPDDAFYLIKVWANMNYQEADNQTYNHFVLFESPETIEIDITTKACSFGKSVAEKVEDGKTKFENGKHIYKSDDTKMCDFMVGFIRKLKNELPSRELMNHVLENFTILQTVTVKDTHEILLYLGYVFEIADSSGTQSMIYKLYS
ncbi:unnamed protein product [Didymodactylos carnosus]|nr:unnamed protein product [Didymodactylos carnosus]CAF3798824.1 unnamed protein product [Didymodactylos carnosus]